MSRSDQARRNSLRASCAHAAVGCVLVLAGGCRFASAPSDGLPVGDAGESAQQASQDASVSTSVGTDTTETGSSSPAAATEDASVQPSAAGAQAEPSAAPDLDTPANGSTPASGSTEADGGTASDAAPPGDPSAAESADAAVDAGGPPVAAGGAGAADPHEVQCAADLASCLLRDPLGYATCLRLNQANHCQAPDSGVPTTSPVTTEDGKPLSQACQAELASCIMRMPTPENAASCTEQARKCT